MPLKATPSIAREVVQLAAPIIGRSLLETLVFLVDRAMLGHYTAEALASMQISGPMIWAISSIFSAFAVGAIALVGRAVGSGDRALASATARGSLLLAFVVGTVLAILSLVSIDTILNLFPAAEPSVRLNARAYLLILLPTMPLMLLSLVSAALLQAAGNTRTPFIVALFANGVNAVLNYCLIFGNYGAPTLGIRGAAIGSAMAIAINAFVLLALLTQRHGVLTLRGRGGESDALSRVLRISAPALGERLVQHIGYLGFVAFIGALGGVAMAANQILISIESICFLSAEGLGLAAAAIVAQRLGAGRPDEASAGAQVAMVMALGLLGLCGCVFVLFPTQLLCVFSQDPKLIAIAIPCLYIAAAAQPFMAMSFVLGDALRGAGDTRTAFYSGLQFHEGQ